MRGLGRVVVLTIVNFIIVFVAIAVIYSIIFSIYTYDRLKILAEEEIRAYKQSLSQQHGLSPQAIERLVEEQRRIIYEKYGLDLPVQYRIFYYTKCLVTFNLTGIPISGHATYPVPGNNALEVTLNGMARSAVLFTTATIIAILVDLLFGVRLAQRAGGLLDKIVATLAMFQNSLPLWWTALIMIMLFAYVVPIFPSKAIGVEVELRELRSLNLPFHEYIVKYVGAWIKYMSLPLITIFAVSLLIGVYSMRTLVLIISREDFVTVARAKGLPERMILYKHILRAASPPIVTSMVFSIIGSLGGALISERIFHWPGAGYVFYLALYNEDAGLLIVNTWVITLLYLIAIFALDFIYMLLDPRVRVGKGVEE